MKTLVTYSSLTGNTKKVAEAVASAIPGSELHPIDQSPDPSGYDLILAGFWVDRGEADRKTKEFLGKLQGKAVGFFFTLGAYPDSAHADDVARVTGELIERGQNEPMGSFRCQGKVDPALLGRMKKSLPPDHPHARMTEERKARLTEAAKHPNDKDLEGARAFALEAFGRAGGGGR